MHTLGSSGQGGAPDPSPRADSGMPRDATALHDASMLHDASAPHDASTQHDDSASTPTGPSEGCGRQAPGGDGADHFALHRVTVTGVDPAFIAAHPASGGSWTDRSYYVRLPADYDPAKAYPLSIGGGGCGNTDGTSGSGGGLSALPQGQKLAIQVGLNYVYPQNAGACFADDFVNTPDLPYFDAVLAQLEADYCVDRGKVFVAGFSSGAWETYMLGCARAGVVRAIGTAAGGLRMTRPPCTQLPIAAILVAGLNDTENPIGPLAPPGKNDSLGSAPARDDILARNGCTGTATEPWDAAYPACVKYSGCPAASPVVWCAIDAGHGNGGEISARGFWQLWSSLPDP
jgi:poly(3-hydroxybutyrate) depolymerase